MSDPTATDVALKFVREEIQGLRTTVHSEVSGIRADVASLAGELRAHMAEQGPRQAVIEHRLTGVETDVVDLRAEMRAEVAELKDDKDKASNDRRATISLWFAGLSLLCTIAAVIFTAVKLGG